MRKFLSRFLAIALIPAAVAVGAGDALANPEGMNPRELRKMARKGVTAQALKQVCNSVSPMLPGQMLVKSELSSHITAPGDSRKGSYTLVCGNQCPRSFPASFFYSDGSLAGKLGYYGTFSGNGRPRAYCGAGGAGSCNARTINGIASRKRTGKLLYLQIDAKKKVCKSFAGSGRNGGV